MSVDLTIIIPHRGDDLGLWATVQSCQEDLRHSDLKYNFVLVVNGEEKESFENRQLIEILEKTGKLCKYLYFKEPLTPPAARGRGVKEADGEYLFFFDNHCLVSHDYFRRAMADFRHYGMDMLHSSTIFYSDQFVAYHYMLRLEYNFWADACLFPAKELQPYKIAAGGHGGFAVKRSVWDEVGGYGPEGLFIGYGGEEISFDLKMALYGKTNYIDPRVIHYHYTSNRSYSRHYTDEYYTNMMISAYVIGGEKWLYKLFDSFSNRSHIRLRPKKTMYELLETAQQRGSAYAAEIASKRLRTLDEQLMWFRENEIMH